MKKILALLCVAVGAFVLTACGENNPYDLNKKKSLEETSIVLTNQNANITSARAVSIPEGVVDYSAFTVYDKRGLILTMNDGTNKLAREDFTIVTSGTNITSAIGYYFEVTSTIDGEICYGLFDYSKEQFLIPLSTDQITICCNYDQSCAVASVGKKVYNLNKGNLLTDGEVGSKSIDLDMISELRLYDDGFALKNSTSQSYSYTYYDLDLNLVGQFSIKKNAIDTNAFLTKNGDVIVQELYAVSKDDYYDLVIDTSFIDIKQYIYEEKTGNKREIDMPFYIESISYYLDDEVTHMNNSGIDFSQIKDYNFVDILPFQNKVFGGPVFAMFNSEMTELVHTYSYQDFTYKIDENLYMVEDLCFYDKDGKVLSEIEYESELIANRYTLLPGLTNSSIADETGKIVMSDLKILSLMNSTTFLFSTNDAGELLACDVKAGTKEVIASSYSDFASYNGCISYKNAEGATVYVGNDGSTLFTVSSTGTAQIVTSTKHRTYFKVTESSGTVTYILSY